MFSILLCLPVGWWENLECFSACVINSDTTFSPVAVDRVAMRPASCCRTKSRDSFHAIHLNITYRTTTKTWGYKITKDQIKARCEGRLKKKKGQRKWRKGQNQHLVTTWWCLYVRTADKAAAKHKKDQHTVVGTCWGGGGHLLRVPKVILQHFFHLHFCSDSIISQPCITTY